MLAMTEVWFDGIYNACDSYYLVSLRMIKGACSNYFQHHYMTFKGEGG